MQHEVMSGSTPGLGRVGSSMRLWNGHHNDISPSFHLPPLTRLHTISLPIPRTRMGPHPCVVPVAALMRVN